MPTIKVTCTIPARTCRSMKSRATRPVTLPCTRLRPGGGGACSHHILSFGVAEVVPIVRTNVSRESRLISDEARQYVGLGKEFAEHRAVNHGVYEWGSGDIHTNTVESYYSIFKRGMKGVYQHCAEKHLHRYLAEFYFRYNNRVKLGIDDIARAGRALKGIVGKRLAGPTVHFLLQLREAATSTPLLLRMHRTIVGLAALLIGPAYAQVAGCARTGLRRT